MALIDDAVQLVHDYVDGRIARANLENWLAQNAQAVADAHDSDLNQLFGQAYGLLAELGYGHRTESEVRSELAAFMNNVRIDCTQWTVPAATSTDSTAVPAAAQFSNSPISFRSQSLDVRRSPVIA